MARDRPPVILIREAAPGDLAAVRAVVTSCWVAAYSSIVGDRAVAGMAHDLLQDGDLAALASDAAVRMPLASIDGEPAATALARRSGPHIKLIRLYVLARFHRLGLGAALIDYAARQFPDCAHIRLNVEASNHSAMAFYLSQGFFQTGTATETIAGVAFQVRNLER